MNFSRYEGKGIDVGELIRQADTMPFFAEKRLILVEDSGFFKASSEELASYLPSMPDTTCIIFAESQVDKRNRLYKKVKELGYAAKCSCQDAAQLARWAGGILAREERKITGRTGTVLMHDGRRYGKYPDGAGKAHSCTMGKWLLQTMM